MIKDMTGQKIEPGQKAVWTSYNHLHIGTVKRVTAKRVFMEGIYRGGISSWTHMPLPEKIMIVNELPKSVLFWALKG